MANSPDYVAHVLELARGATARRMFGGHGIYLDGIIVGIVVNDVLYLKTDDESRVAFTALGLLPFSYTTKTGATQVTSYYAPPDDALESPDAMREWVRLALAAALRAAQRKRAPRKRSTTRTTR